MIPVASHAADRTIIVKKRSQVTQEVLKKLDTTDPRTFDCGNIQSSLQQLICRGGLIPSNKQLVSDRQELAIALGRNQMMADKSHRAWLLSRNADCEMEAAGFTGVMASSAYVGCIIAANRKRHDFLTAQIDRLNSR